MHQISTTDLPQVPFSIYFLDSNLEVYPKRVYTITSIRISNGGDEEVYVKEFGKFILYDSKHMPVVNQFFVN